MKVSVIVPVFNGQKYLQETLQSANAQRHVQIELIVVIDGSSDQSAQIAENCGARVLVQANQGVAVARNTGVQKASADYLAFLDQDDLWHPDKLHQQLEVLKHGDYAVCHTDTLLEADALPYKHLIREAYHHQALALTPSALMVSRDVFKLVGWFNPAFKDNSDVDWFARAVELGLRMVNPENVLLTKRFHSFNQSHHVIDSVTEVLQILRASVQRRRQP